MSVADLYPPNISNAETVSLLGSSFRPRYSCPQPRCNKSYRRKGELTRHIATAHERPASFHCHFDRCPRSILGKGFARKDKLVEHLVSKKHGMSKVDARYYASFANE
jgi:uncharacterized C2H2 Zn-finger protein